MGGLAMGFLGAGLFGLLSGSGFFGGLGSLMGILGLAVQIALVVLHRALALNYFRNRQPPAAAAANAAGHARQAAPQPGWTGRRPRSRAAGDSARSS
jgi:predicted lipid-binding transport protein (Tim44 family)